MSKGGGSVTIGFKYFFGIHMLLGRGPVDEVVSARVGGRIAWQGHATSTGQVRIDAAELFGGDVKEGGIEGPMDILMGEPDQLAPASMTRVFGDLPGFRRRLTVFFNGMIGAMNPYPKAWEFRVRRSVKGWDGEVFRPDLAKIILTGE